MTENGLRATVDYLKTQVDRLWEHKASSESVATLGRDVREIKTQLSELLALIEKRQEAAGKERKSDRRWMIGTSLTAAGLVIAALGIILPHLS